MKITRIFFWLCINILTVHAQVNVGSASYTTSFPGTDAAGRNGFPSGLPQLSGNALNNPVPTNDWWSKLVKENHADNLFNYPMTFKTTDTGLIVTYIPWGVIGDNTAIKVGLTGLNTSKTTVFDYSDWTVTMNWSDSDNSLNATSGIGMPFIYYEKDNDDIVEITINSGTVTISNEIILIENASSGADFVVYAPLGSTWTQDGNVLTSTLDGKDYWSMAMLPQDTSNINNVAEEYKKYAYVFPTNTTTTWSYNESNSKVTTTFNVTTDIKEGVNSNVLMGLLPHQWSNLASSSASPQEHSYQTVRGQLKTLDGNSFIVENTFKGILPTLPYLANYSVGFSPSSLSNKIDQIKNDELATWTDSYNEGQVMNRLIQTARIADQTGDIQARDTMISTIKERLEDWLTYQSGEVAFLFYYNSNWSSMLGYPSGHGQDNNINDHHFHWGYFIHAAAFMEQFEPEWSLEWGDMINILIRDAASYDRNDPDFPFLRNFSPYAGHSWANGFASFPQGNDQESTSESMQFASALIHWGTITEDDAIRDLGIYIYTTEQTAIEEYWFDIYDRNFQPSQGYSLVSRVWGNSYDNGTFWTSDIAASYGIEMYPIHGGSLYLGHNHDYSDALWAEITQNTGILSNEENDNLWHDTYWKYLSMINAQEAVNLYDSYPNRNLKFGISDAQTYHWLHAMNALGRVDATVTADHPIAAVFIDDGIRTYVAHNYSNFPITVTFSDDFILQVPARQMVTSKDSDGAGVLTSDFLQAYPGGSVNLFLEVSGTNITKVEFYDGTTKMGEDVGAPYQFQATNLTLGIHGMYAKIYSGEQFNISNTVNIQVGEQVPYLDTPFEIPGVIEAGYYDEFEGGVGQNISYLDFTVTNIGDFRSSEYVDATLVTNEGATVGWNSAGEWLEYSIVVETAGLYNLNMRYASGNSSGGGPIHFEIEDTTISPSITLAGTNGWDNWQTKTVSNIELNEGEHVLRLVVDGGEFNFGKMNFSYDSALSYVPPVANAGDNVSVILPSTTISLDGSLSNDPEGQAITYEWDQLYGPTTVGFTGSETATPALSNLVEGIYKFKLTVSDGVYQDSDEVLVIVTATGNSSPSVVITAPSANTTFPEGSDINITTSVSDLDGTVNKVEFFDGTTKIAEDITAPFSYLWTGASVGNHQLKAVATDNDSGQGTSQLVPVTVNEVQACTEISNAAQQGAFSTGYEVTFETVGDNVTITFKLLDTDKVGVIAYLWRASPFEESQMNEVSDLTFSKTLSGFTVGETISYGCKFAFAGGLAATTYYDYVVGDSCSGSENEPPTNISANAGNVTSSTIELLLNGTDDSGVIAYDVTYGSESASTTGDSGVQESLTLNNLSPDTTYNFSIRVSDLSGNEAANSPISLQVTTAADTNTACSGIESEASQGEFSIGYNYSFETSGSNVIFTFELLDTDKTGVIAYLWRQSPFQEQAMTSVSGLEFTTTVGGFTNGQNISYACKFAYAGGQVVTKYLSYEVGSTCDSFGIMDQSWAQSVMVYPNPASNRLTIKSLQTPVVKVELFSMLGHKVLELLDGFDRIYVDDLSDGLYFIKVYSDLGSTTRKIIKH
jgi:endoglucanase Acf2